MKMRHFDPKYQKFSGEGAQPSSQFPFPVGRETPSSHTPPSSTPSAPRFGSCLRRSTLPPTSTTRSAYELTNKQAVGLIPPFTRSSKRRANVVFKIHRIIARRLLDVCSMFVSIHPASSTSYGN